MAAGVTNGRHCDRIESCYDREDLSALEDIFYRLMIPEVSASLGEVSSGSPTAGYKRAWRVFLGINLYGKLSFFCHITEDFPTAKALTIIDRDTPWCPSMIHMEPFDIEDGLLDRLRECAPAGSSLQLALAINYKDYHNSNSSSSPLELLARGILETAHFKISSMLSTGYSALQFSTPDSPVICWSHQALIPIMHDALSMELKKRKLDPEVIQLFEQASTLELLVRQMTKAVLSQRNELSEIESQIKLKSPNPYFKDKWPLIKNSRQSLTSLKTQRKNHIRDLNRLDKILLNTINLIHQFKENHGSALPRNYGNFAVELSFAIEFPDGLRVYKGLK